MFARRLGKVVIRPRHRGSHSCARLLAFLHAAGFDAVPEPLGIDHKWERVSYVEGVVPGVPLPDWASTDGALRGVAGLLRSYHEAVRAFPKSKRDRWGSEVPESFQGDILCHHDVSPSNVVFVNGAPGALIDFELAGPAHPLWDVALAVRHWAPLKDPEYLEPGHKKIDIVARFGTFCNAYGMNRADRKKVIDGAVISLDMGLQAVRERMKRDFLYQILWLRDYEGINRRSRSWLERNREVLITAP